MMQTVGIACTWDDLSAGKVKKAILKMESKSKSKSARLAPEVGSRMPQIEKFQEARPVRVGIVGCGNVMDGRYMPVLERLQQKGAVRVVARLTLAASDASKFSTDASTAKYFNSYQDLCRREKSHRSHQSTIMCWKSCSRRSFQPHWRSTSP